MKRGGGASVSGALRQTSPAGLVIPQVLISSCVYRSLQINTDAPNLYGGSEHHSMVISFRLEEKSLDI